MSDISELLQDTAPSPGPLDLERVHRHGRRIRRRPWIVSGAVAVVVALALGAVVVTRDDEHGHGRVIAPPATAGPTVTLPATTSAPATTTGPTTTTTVVPAREDRLSSASRLGFAGIGPIQLGMTFDDAERLGQLAIVPGVCPSSVRPDPGSDLPTVGVYVGISVWPTFPYTEPPTVKEIDVNTPAISTISGIHLGSTYGDVLRTYPGATPWAPVLSPDPTQRTLAITNPEGRIIAFYFGADDTVLQMSLGFNSQVLEGNRVC